jgi:trans-aconitate methyltransferase
MAERTSEPTPGVRPPEFDAHASAYDADLAAGLRLTGGDKHHYAEERTRWLVDRLAALGQLPVRRVLDFGCGDGDAAPLLRDVLKAREVVGVDVSPAMLERARSRHPWATWAAVDDLPSLGPFDVAYCNGVFHHIPRAERLSAARAVHAALAPGGVWGFWENHPWNPGTRLVMSRVRFDRDADLLSPPAARRLLRSAGFLTLRTDHLFILPVSAPAVRRAERLVSRLPIGGQYMVLARRP